MNSGIYIDGMAVWALLIMVAILFAGFIYFGNAYIAEARENDRLRSRVKQYSAQLKEYEQAEYKDSFLNDLLEHKTAKQKDGLLGEIILLDVSAPKFPKGGERHG